MKKFIIFFLLSIVNFVQAGNHIKREICYDVLKNKITDGVFVKASSLHEYDSSKVHRIGSMPRKIFCSYKSYDCYVKIATPARALLNHDTLQRTIEAHINQKYEHEVVANNDNNNDCYEIIESIIESA